MALFNQIVHAEPEDIVAYNYAAAQAPGIQSCTTGYDLLSGDITYSKNQITGALPYNLSYRGPLRRNFSAAQNFFQPETSSLGWTDNYQGHILVQNIYVKNTSFSYKMTGIPNTSKNYAESYNPVVTEERKKSIIVRLPGESSDTVFLEKNGSFKRLYSVDSLFDLNKVGFSYGWDNGASDDLGEYTLSRSGNSLTISKNGIQYTITNSSYVMVAPQTSTKTTYVYHETGVGWTTTDGQWSYPSDVYTNTTLHSESTATVSIDLYRVTKIDNKQGGILNFQYDNKMNLTQVNDQYNNKLVFERTFHDPNLGATQTVSESRLITKVTYTAAQGGTQTATFNYKSYANKVPTTGSDTMVFALVSSDSTVAGAYSYVNEMTEIGAIKLYVARKGNTPDASYYFPVLTQVNDSAGQMVQRWFITQNYVVIGTGKSANFSIAATTLRTYLNSSASRGTTAYYDDNRNMIELKSIVTPIKDIITKIKTASDGSIEITGAPCLTVNGHPIKNARFDAKRSRLIYFTDKNNIPTSYQYDGNNRLTEIVESGYSSMERKTSYTYGVLNNQAANLLTIPTKIVTPDITITNVINPRGQIVTQTQSSRQTGSTSKVTTYGYDETATSKHFGRLLSVDGPRSGTADKIIYAYDTYGNLASQTQTVNGAARITQYLGYNTFGNPERIVNPSGLVSQFIYNTDGTLKSQTTGVGGTTGTIAGQTTSYTYNTIKQRISETNPDGEVTNFTYDQVGILLETKLPNGNRIQNTYYDTGTLKTEKRVTAQGGISLEVYQYLDDNGRVNKIQNGSDTARQYTTFLYDDIGNLIQSTSAEGITEKWTYDAFNRVTSHTDSAGNVDTKEYDVNDNIVLSKDALNAGSNPFSYRNGNVLTQEVNSDYGTKAYTYNEADQLIQRLHGPRKCNYNTLDELGRYKAFVCAANSGTTANEYQVNDNYSYDQSRYGRLDKVTTGLTGYDVDTLYTYDAYDRVTQKGTTNQLFNRYANTPGNTLNVNYGYSTGGKLTSMTLPSGRSLTYSYSSTTGMLTGINLNGSALVRSLSYDGANRITGWQWGALGNAGYTQSYNNDGSIATLTNKDNASAVNYSLTFGYDKDGRITLVTRHNGTKDAYTYDVVDRLLSESRTTGTAATYSISYTYDKNGNRLTLNATGQHMQPAASAAYTYTANTNKLASFTKGGVAQTFSHTANSELSYGTYLPTYDNAGRRKVDRASTDYYYMNYNHKNERSFRDKVANGAVATMTQYIYDEQSHLIGEYDKTGALVEYVWMGDKPVAVIYGSGAATKIYYIVTDHLNTPRRLVDGVTHAVVWSWDSTAFGVGNPTGSITFNLRFPGQYYDVGTNQFYNHNRFYNPELGRYMEPDPIGLEGGLNPYAYAGSNPVMNVDLSGLSLRQMDDFGLSMTRGSDYSLDNMILNQQINQFNNLQTLNIGYGPNYTSVSYDNSYQNMWAATYSFSVGANTTPILGIGGQTGTYVTTGDKGSFWDEGDAGYFVTGSKTIGLGAGIGVSFDYWQGGRSSFDGKAMTNTLCGGPFCIGLHTDTSGNYAGWGFTIGGDSGGGMVPGASFTHSTDYTKSLTIRDLIQLLNKKGKN
ncbi:RHS repeat-associated core domain-containing protein [Acinetobacter oleivorans]|uniref:RHS repeat-associated core domain-containing protein n=1 Tax=Acinetobacter oleivorans TaxID=1148157 RepID=UPI00208F3F9C|nr:RHS repeat-associated core domain-containing protein [Acinetobacter oleivorans]